jgi:DNA-binding NarL/FixJ family response regulator
MGVAEKVRLLIVDDHERVRQGLVAQLRRSPDLEVVGATGDAEEAVRWATERHPDVVLLDVKRCDGCGTELCRRLSHDGHPPVVIVLTSYLAPQEWEEVRRAGAQAYLLKQIDSKALAVRIKEEVAGRASSPHLNDR